MTKVDVEKKASFFVFSICQNRLFDGKRKKWNCENVTFSRNFREIQQKSPFLLIWLKIREMKLFSYFLTKIRILCIFRQIPKDLPDWAHFAEFFFKLAFYFTRLVSKTKLQFVSVSIFVHITQYRNFRNFLSLRFHVKSILGILEVQNVPFLPFWGSLILLIWYISV